MRLVPPTGATEFDFLGRVEVFHDNEWGTICDTNFYSSAAEIACQMLNFTEGVRCTVYNSNLGRGQGSLVCVK